MNAVSLLILSAIIVSCSTQPKDIEADRNEMSVTTLTQKKVEKIGDDQVVVLGPKGIDLDYTYFKVVYDKESRLPFYVQYTITKEDLRGNGKRRDNFHPDLSLKKHGIDPVSVSDYKKSGYDKGHMAPAGDFNRSQKAIDSTFVMTNMTPQKGSLNQQAWRYLEAKVRGWICGEKKLTIVTGPIIKPGLKKLKSGVAIPEQFFKAVFDHTPPVKSICFIYNQSDRKDVMSERAMSVDECEKKVGYELSNEYNSNTFELNDWVDDKC